VTKQGPDLASRTVIDFLNDEKYDENLTYRPKYKKRKQFVSNLLEAGSKLSTMVTAEGNRRAYLIVEHIIDLSRSFRKPIISILGT